MDSSLYYSDLVAHHPGWESGVTVAKDAMNNAILRGYGKGYIRIAMCRDDMLPRKVDGSLSHLGESHIYYEKIRYLAYSSWVAGGQGIIFFRYDHGDAKKWFDGYGGVVPISAQITEEAYTMQDWLMDEPATDIEAYCYDSLGNNSRVRFILRRNQWGSGVDDRILLLFCNFADDGQTHFTYIYFPNHTISQVDKVKSYMNGAYTIVDNNTLRFDPTNMDSTDVYGSACFLTLSAQ